MKLRFGFKNLPSSGNCFTWCQYFLTSGQPFSHLFRGEYFLLKKNNIFFLRSWECLCGAEHFLCFFRWTGENSVAVRSSDSIMHKQTIGLLGKSIWKDFLNFSYEVQFFISPRSTKFLKLYPGILYTFVDHNYNFLKLSAHKN